MSVLTALLTAMNISVCIMTAACNGGPMQSELLQMAVMLPREDVYNMYLNKCKVEDYNGDGLPEVYLAAASGWEYHVYYYLDGEMYTVEDLKPWAWSSDLCIAADGRLVLYTWPHTVGTDGNYTYRIYEWTEGGYCLTEDLWSEPDERDWDGTVLSCVYFSSKTAFDHFLFDDEDYAEIQIPQEEYEQKIESLGKLTSVFTGDDEWGWDFWEQHEYDDDYARDELYREIQEEILDWK
ncbi:MAG: hypothetical protein K2N00_02980 [Lachnospiraceae bacterium]|nr:hypothetical protein [Lachnospiraceae bacterium]